MIFVSIAAYSDPHIVNTVVSAFERSDHPWGIKIGVALSGEVPPGLVPKLSGMGVRIDFGPAIPEGIGAARARALSLWRDEKLIVQVDAHTRFAKNWDTKLQGLTTLAAATSRNWVVSSWLPGWVPGLLSAPGRPEFARVGRSGLPVLERRKITPGRLALERGDYVWPHFVAAPVRFWGDCPPDPRIRGPGEAVIHSARARGFKYQIFHPAMTLAAHHDIRAGARFSYHADPLEALDAEVWRELDHQPVLGGTVGR